MRGYVIQPWIDCDNADPGDLRPWWAGLSAPVITRPSNMIVILVSDLFEGGNRDEMLRRVAEMTAVGAQVSALLALSDADAPVYHHDNAAAVGVLGLRASQMRSLT
jgi:hypothetical protein